MHGNHAVADWSQESCWGDPESYCWGSDDGEVRLRHAQGVNADKALLNVETVDMAVSIGPWEALTMALALVKWAFRMFARGPQS